MTYEFIVYGDVRFNVDYSIDELKSFILSYIETNKEVGSFSYLRLCRALIDTAVKEGRLEGAQKNTYYQSPQLKPEVYSQISCLLWNFILSGKIFIDFYSNEYVTQIPNDTIFGINKAVVK